MESVDFSWAHRNKTVNYGKVVNCVQTRWYGPTWKRNCWYWTVMIIALEEKRAKWNFYKRTNVSLCFYKKNKPIVLFKLNYGKPLSETTKEIGWCFRQSRNNPTQTTFMIGGLVVVLFGNKIWRKKPLNVRLFAEQTSNSFVKKNITELRKTFFGNLDALNIPYTAEQKLFKNMTFLILRQFMLEETYAGSLSV